MRRVDRLKLGLGTFVIASFSSWPAMVRTAETGQLRTTLERERERRALARALAGAVRRLQRPSCRRIFLDFKDPAGRTLQEGLDAVGQDGASFLRDWVFFADGGRERSCADPRVLAFTQPGSRAIWICGRRFSRERLSDPGYAEVVLIHELLHALGLAEGPPASKDISRQVEARCGN